MTSLIDKANFEDLAKLDPKEVCSRTNCSYDKTKKEYNINIWGFDYIVDPFGYKIKSIGSSYKSYHDFLELFILYYLLKARPIHEHQKWISEKDITGGTAFFRGPHTIPTDLIVKKYDNHIGDFKNRCEAVGGKSLDMADASYSFEITDRIPVAVLFWNGDEDFAGEAKLLFDQSIEEHLPLDIIFALAVEVCNRISQ